MNIEFKYDKGDKKIIVSNQYGVMIEMKYTDNVKELLIQENKIENINMDISSLEKIEECITTN